MAFTQDSIAKQPTVNDIWSTQSNGSTSTNDSNKTIATQGASTTVSPYLQRPSHNPRLENFGNSIANTNNTTNSWNNNNTTSSNSSLPKLLASTTGPKQSSVPDNLEKFPTIVDDTKENVDWSQQIPGIINEILGDVLNNIGDKDKEFNPNAYDLASLWFGDIIANTPNVSRAYTDTINQFLSGVNNRSNDASSLLNNILNQYTSLGNGAQGSYNNFLNLGANLGQNIADTQDLSNLPIYQQLMGGVTQAQDLGNLNSYQSLVDALTKNSDIANTPMFNEIISKLQGFTGLENTQGYKDAQGSINNTKDLSNYDSYQSLINSLGQYKDLGSLNSYQDLQDLALAQGMNIDSINALLAQIDPQYSQALNQQLGEYGNLQNQGANINQQVNSNREGLNSTKDTITNNILNAYQNVLTGNVPEASQQNIDKIFQSNLDLINQAFDDTMTRERRQLVDNMAGRGILTSGVTGRAYGDIVDSALREKQKSMSEIASQRASSMLELPYRQAQQANTLNDHLNSLNNLTTSETNDLINILQTQYGMSKDNAALAIQNITNKFSQQNAASQLGTQAQGQLQSLLQNMLGIDVQNQQAMLQTEKGIMDTDVQNQQMAMQAQQALLQMQEQARQNQLVQEQNLLGTQLQNQQANTTAQQTLLSTEAQNQQNNIQTLYNMLNSQAQNTQAGQNSQNQLLNALLGYDTNYQANQLSNVTQQANFGNQNLQLQQAIAQSAPDAIAKMFDQYGALSQGFLNQLLQREMNALNAEAQVQAAGAANRKSSSSGVIGTILGGLLGGSGGGCVRRGTKITMNDGSYKNAEDIKEGDKIRSFDVKTNTYNEAIVDHVEVTTFTNFYEVTPHDGKMIEVSSYHPFLVYTGKKYKFKLIGYWHAIRNVIKHVVTQPKKVIDSIKFGWLSLTRYGILKRHDIIMKDNFENSQIKSILKREGKDVFFNFRLSKYDYPTFIANDIVIEALYEETEKFVKWVAEEGISFDA